jgi:ribonuclease-3
VTANLNLEDRLHYRFKDRALLARALTHRSLRHESSGGEDYERLEFLGDALLGFLVGEWLLRADLEANEGELTRRKQSVVSTAPLAEAARRLGLGDELRLGRGEEGTGGRAKTSLLVDAFEAVLGAVYMDGGLRPARAFVKRHLADRLAAARRGGAPAEDHKTRLQEAVQARWRVTPRYRIVATTGLAHARRFEAEVLVGERVVGAGSGASRKQAEQAAARSALAEIA